MKRVPDALGRFGAYGGRYVPETLVAALDQLAAEYERARGDEAFAAAHLECPTGWIEVVAQRALARAVAERTGVRHESPQALWLEAGRVRWNASHSAITEASLAAATGAKAR